MKNEIKTWENENIPYKGNTPFGYYDDDDGIEEFVQSSIEYVTLSLGYPIIDIKLSKKQLYANMEMAIKKYLSEMYIIAIHNEHSIERAPKKFSDIHVHGISWILSYFKALCLNTLSMGKMKYQIMPISGEIIETNFTEIFYHSIESMEKLEKTLLEIYRNFGLE